MPSASQIIELIRRKPKIPAPSQAVSRVLSMTRDADCDIPKVAEVVAKDPGLTVQLLRQANSALYGCTMPTSSVLQACVRLGLKRVRSAVINQHVVNGLSQAFPPGVDANRLWQSALAISVAAHDLAKRLSPGLAEDAATAGLLCDLGIGLLAFAIPGEYRPVLAELGRVGFGGLPGVERTRLGLTHADVGAAVLADWKLEPSIIAAVKLHHSHESPAATGDHSAHGAGESDDGSDEPADQAAARLAQIVRVAVMLSEIALEGSDMERVDALFGQVELLSPQADALVAELLESLVANLQKTAQSLSVELGATDDMEANLAALMREAAAAEGIEGASSA